jgi:hypothetical protein
MAESETFQLESPEQGAEIAEKARAEHEGVTPNPEQTDEAVQAEAAGETEEVEEEAVNDLQISEDEEEEVDAEEVADKLGLDYQALYSEYMKNGELSPESSQKIVDAGVPQELLNVHLAGLQALNTQRERAAFDVVGGKDQYTALVGWAKENLSESEIAAFNAGVTSSNEAAVLAVQGLNARFQQSGAAPSPAEKSLSPRSATTLQGEAPIKSRAELVRLISTDQYKNDPAFREKVERQLAAAQKTGQYRIV